MLYRLSYVSLSSLPKLLNKKMERVAGIEPASSAWKAEVLPLNYTRGTLYSVVFSVLCSAIPSSIYSCKFKVRIYLVVGEGFEPSKVKPSDLQSDPFGRLGTPPKKSAKFSHTQESSQRRKISLNYQKLRRPLGKLVPPPRVELGTSSLQVRRSTN